MRVRRTSLWRRRGAPARSTRFSGRGPTPSLPPSFAKATCVDGSATRWACRMPTWRRRSSISTTGRPSFCRRRSTTSRRARRGSCARSSSSSKSSCARKVRRRCWPPSVARAGPTRWRRRRMTRLCRTWSRRVRRRPTCRRRGSCICRFRRRFARWRRFRRRGWTVMRGVRSPRSCSTRLSWELIGWTAAWRSCRAGRAATSCTRRWRRLAGRN